MNDARSPGKPHRPASRPVKVDRPAATQDDFGTVVAWQSGSGKDVSYNIVHVDPAGVTGRLYLSDGSQLRNLINEVNARPDDAASIIGTHKKALRLPREKLARVAFTQKLKQLTIVDDTGKKHDVPAGDDGDQAQIFEAVNHHLGGTAGDEEADAWSVIQVSLFALLVTIAAGVFFTIMAADADPNFVAQGKNAAQEQMMNNLGVKIGPVWTAVAFAAVAIGIATPMVFRLKNRPKRKVLSFQ